jgi:hypothetical protein
LHNCGSPLPDGNARFLHGCGAEQKAPAPAPGSVRRVTSHRLSTHRRFGQEHLLQALFARRETSVGAWIPACLRGITRRRITVVVSGSTSPRVQYAGERLR